MAGDWIKFEIGTSDKPEVWAIAQSLNIDPDAVVGKLLRVWSWFDQHTEAGNAPCVTKMLLDRLVGVTGFCDCVVGAGWMVDDGINIGLPNFDRHNGKTAKNRALTAKRVANHKRKTNDGGNAEVTQDALPREEKRREDSLPDGKERGAYSQMIDLPEWIDSDKWDSLVDHLAGTKRSHLTIPSALALIAQLARAMTFGHVPNELIETAIANNWKQVVFPDNHFKQVKADKSAQHESPSEQAKRMRRERDNSEV